MNTYSKQGRLTIDEAKDANAMLDKTDIVFRSLRDPKHFSTLEVSNGFMGVQNRGILTVDTLRARTCKNDLVQLLSGGAYFETMALIHDAAFTYNDGNHADVFQAFAKNQRWKDGELFDGLYIGTAAVIVLGSKKNGFMFTERCVYSNIELFGRGLVYETNNKQPYFLDTTNFNGAVLGSPEYPLDPRQLSNKALRCGGNKKGIPDSSNIVIHSYDDLKMDLNHSARKALNWIQYDRKQTTEQRVQMFTGAGTL